MGVLPRVAVTEGARIPTWFGVGGGADRLAHPETPEQVRECLELDPGAKVLGDGANLLVCDEGVAELVIDLKNPGFRGWEIDDATGEVRAKAGADLARLINECVRRGLGGLEALAGVPATLGGAVVMNAGGAFGEIGQFVTAVHAMDRAGRQVTVGRPAIDFGYRRSGLSGLVILGVDLQLKHDDRATLRQRHLEVMEYKRDSQPLKANSAGCCFKNPTLTQEVKELGERGAPGQRVSAGMLIDRAGLKGLRVGGAVVSERHANFLVPEAGATATDVISLMREVERRVRERFGVTLEREVVVWERSGGG
ncbi:MAG: UDP-N-acetylmuramate dehydrogenase [Leptolyngbya sp. PLA1]|nr:UDP-N-acetylmuramate dehydrogenase [Leptolyngbya sp. PLA1]